MGFGLISAQRNRARRHTAYTAYGAAKINHQGESCDLREPKFLLISLLFSRHYPMLNWKYEPRTKPLIPMLFGEAPSGQYLIEPRLEIFLYVMRMNHISRVCPTRASKPTKMIPDT